MHAHATSIVASTYSAHPNALSQPFPCPWNACGVQFQSVTREHYDHRLTLHYCAGLKYALIGMQRRVKWSVQVQHVI